MNDLERRFRAAVPRFSREGWNSAEARELRRQAVAHVRRRYQAGERVAVMSPRLGLAEATLYRWIREALDDDERAPRLRRRALSSRPLRARKAGSPLCWSASSRLR